MSKSTHDALYRISNSYLSSPLEFGDTQLWQIGRLYCNAGSVVPSHKHPFLYEITAVSAGKGTVYTNGKPTEVRVGSIYLSFPYDTHEIISDTDDPLQYDFFAFTTKDTDLSRMLQQIAADLNAPESRLIPDGGIASLISDALSELHSNLPYSERIMKSLLEQIIIRVIRSASLHEDQTQKASVTDAETICYRAMHYIDSHIFLIKNLTDVAKAMNYNYSYLSNLFKKTTNIGLMDYYRKKRLEMARSLLKEKGQCITKTAELLGYSSVYAFSRAFKEEFGITPSQYKRAKKS